MSESKEPPCEECYVELSPENRKVWELFSLCQYQLLRAGVDGVVVGIDCKAVIEILKLYGEDNKEMFEEILYLWNMKQEAESIL